MTLKVLDKCVGFLDYNEIFGYLCRTRIISICGKDMTTTLIKSAHMITVTLLSFVSSIMSTVPSPIQPDHSTPPEKEDIKITTDS